MGKKQAQSVIALEIEKYEKKIAEFQNYLQEVNFQFVEDKYKEGDLHIKLMNALPTWILALKAMKEDSQAKAKEVEFRGGTEINDAARLMREGK